VIVRRATRDDVPTLVGLIRDLATYEREPDAVEVDDRLLADALFADPPVVFANVADADGAVVGMTIYFRNFSTWTGHLGIYLEDFYVRPEARGQGVGTALLAALADEARTHGYSRIDWSVLRWNKSAIGFYESLGAVPMDEWTGYRLEADGIAALADPTGHWEE
jgi:GNAT superfamily N-acetyltransferase